MRRLLVPLSITGALCACSPGRHGPEGIASVRIIIEHHALIGDSFNRGLGAFYFATFDMKQDSVRYLYPEWTITGDDYQYKHKAYQGVLDSSSYRDTILQLIRMVDRRPQGNVVTPGYENATYCGISYAVEYQKGDHIKSYYVNESANDTSHRFYEFFKRLEYHPWRKQAVAPEAIHLDEELVAYAKREGRYDSLPIPYIFPECGAGIDFSKLAGTWRRVGEDFQSTSTSSFRCVTFRDGKLLLQRYEDERMKTWSTLRCTPNEKNKTIDLVNRNGIRRSLKVRLLNDNCFEVLELLGNEGKFTKFNRLRAQ